MITRLKIFVPVLLFLFAAHVFGRGEVNELITRTFKVDPHAFSDGLKPSGAEILRDQFAAAGIAFPENSLALTKAPGDKAMFLNERKGELIVRASREDMDHIEKIIKSMQKGPPIVQIESKFVEVAIKELPIPYRITPRWGPAMARISAKNLDVSVLTEKQFREVLTAFENAAGADVLTGPAVVTISGRKARLSVEETRSVIYQQSPTLPKDTSPDADPTPRNQGRLPFPPGFGLSGGKVQK